MKYFLIPTLFIFIACSEKPKDPIAVAFDESAMLNKIAHDSAYEVQIIFTDIVRRENELSLKDYTFQLNDRNYFYPASTVKLPAAILSLEKLEYLRSQGIAINRETPFKIVGDTLPGSVASYIAQIFAVSDNNAYNHLYGFLGRDEINERMREKGMLNFQISHRLSTPDSANDTLKTVTFYLTEENQYTQASGINKPIKKLSLNNLEKGLGYYKDDSLIMEPFDFSLKNYYPLTTAHETLKRLFFPEIYPKNQQFNLSDDDRDFLMETMALLPKESRYKPYDSIGFYDSYVKFFLFGDSKKTIPKSIKIYNKVGDAYGYLTDVAYIVDLKNKVEFMLSATIHVNKDEIFNDDNYEYETVGIPFLAELGRQLYQYKLETSKR
ncbi:MAG: hypothetical protein CO119_04920 [Flavobacteriales bacterium CG_4_9_14_3_um_filter_40_17]|nr:MAG: hypothetical protein CO119_04920 [Flavobacteriales bacterium CG_4_9_14_3_um_filter_40_17]